MVEIVKIEPIYVGWTKFSVATFRLDDGSVIRREIEDHGRAASVLPYDPERRVALVARQFRGPVRLADMPDFLEPPAGIIDEGESAADCARREAMEEVGVRLGELEALGTYWASPGSTMERSDLFLAPYSAADRIEAGGGTDDHEDIEVIETPLQDLAGMIDRGELQDLKLFALVQSLRLRRPDLFS